MNKAHILGRTSSISHLGRLLVVGAIALLPSIAAASDPWYIGPKGGDVRKGIPLSQSVAAQGGVPIAQCPPRVGGPKGCACVGSAFPVTGVPLKWQAYVGPKGGITQKGLY
jgi:hypothetical protein